MNILDIIDKKRLGKSLNKDELSLAFNGYLNKIIPDYQMSALLMAITINGLSFEETLDLTDIFINSGERYHFNTKICDKHSTGGIGDTVTLIVGPILAALNIPLIKMSGRGLGITGGTIDKLESIPGYNINLDYQDYLNAIDTVHIALGCQTDKIVPLDKVIYALRDVTGTTDCLGLIASSIMSKKIACGANYVVIDIKCGEGALIKNKDDANILSDWLIQIGKHYEVQVKTIISSMDKPLSNSIGNSLEVLEAIDILNGKKGRLLNNSIEVASLLVSMYESISIDKAKEKCLEVIDNKKAYQSFVKWIENQNGDLSKIKISDKILYIKSNKDGVIQNISSLACGKLSLLLGCGRINKDDQIDYSCGIKIKKEIGDKVKKGDILAELYVKDYNIKLNNQDLAIFTIK